MQDALAIVIPAHKARFLGESLESLCRQTSRAFRVYVGDDASPDDIRSVVDQFRDRLPIAYTRFAENLGGSSLVKQWHRCVSLSGEPWVWLFSDDDVAAPDCVAAFHRALALTQGAYDLYRFDVQFIDGAGEWLGYPAAMPSVMTSLEMLYQRMVNSVFSAAPEHVFRRAALDREGGFVDLPLAWGSDNTTWLAVARRTGVHVIPGPRVGFRSSGLNISSRPDLGPLKAEAILAYMKWLMNRTEDPGFFGLEDGRNRRVMDAIWQSLPKWFYNRLCNDRFPLADRTAVLALRDRMVDELGSRAKDFLAPLAPHLAEPAPEAPSGCCTRLYRAIRNRARRLTS